MGVLDDVYGPDPAAPVAPAKSALDEVYGPDPAAKPARKPDKLLAAAPQPEAPDVRAQKAKATERVLTGLRSAMHGGLRTDARVDALSRHYLQEDPELLSRDVGGIRDFFRAAAMKSGDEPWQPMPATEGTGDKEHTDFPGFLARYGVAGLRPAGAALNAFGEGLRKRIASENPGMTDAQVRSAMWQDTLLDTAMQRPGQQDQQHQVGASS